MSKYTIKPSRDISKAQALQRVKALMRFVYKTPKPADADQGTPGKCWELPRARNEGGYTRVSLKHPKGRYKRNGKRRNEMVLAHRLFYAGIVEDLPKTVILHHECNNPHCVNPKHLRKVKSQKENMQEVKQDTYNGPDSPDVPF